MKWKAAGAYDRCLDEPAAIRGTTFVMVTLGPGAERLLLCGLHPANEPAPVLRAVFDSAIDLLRELWVALLREDCPDVCARLGDIHGKIQEAVLIAEQAWESGLTPARDTAAFLADMCTVYRSALAKRAPDGPGLIVPAQSRASEPYPAVLRRACDDLRQALVALDAARGPDADYRAARDASVRRVRLEDACYQAVGAWRLGEESASRVAERIVTEVTAASAWTAGRQNLPRDAA